MDKQLLEAAPFRVCMLGLLTFAIGREDWRLVREIEKALGSAASPAAVEAQRESEPYRLMLLRVPGPERLWWFKLADVAARQPEYRPTAQQLASLRLGE